MPDDALKLRLEALLVEHGGNVSAIARAMGKSRTQVHRGLKRFDLERRAGGSSESLRPRQGR